MFGALGILVLGQCHYYQANGAISLLISKEDIAILLICFFEECSTR
jgi:hypothetical protein